MGYWGEPYQLITERGAETWVPHYPSPPFSQERDPDPEPDTHILIDIQEQIDES